MNCFAAPFYIKVKEIKKVSPVKAINVREELEKAKSEK
jgi:hypothetical protein